MTRRTIKSPMYDLVQSHTLGFNKMITFHILIVMDDKSKPEVTEEPFPGWQRIEIAGTTPCYKSPFPRTTLTSQAKVKQFLAKEHAAGRYLDVSGGDFSFKRRLGLRSRSTSVNAKEVSLPCRQIEPPKEPIKVKSAVELLTRKPEMAVDHRKLISQEAKRVDAFRVDDSYESPDNFNAIKEKISAADDLKQLLAVLIEDSKISETLTVLMSDICLSEVSNINLKTSPLGKPSYCQSPCIVIVLLTPLIITFYCIFKLPSTGSSVVK